MNVRERVIGFQRRGFSSQAARVNALLEEALAILFERNPGAFVFFGGASLVLFYESPRQSADLDLLLVIDALPAHNTLIEQLTQPLSVTARSLGFENIVVVEVSVGPDHLKLAVRSEDLQIFTIDITKISAVIHSAVIEVSLRKATGEEVQAKILSRDYLLFQKAESFLLRRHLKIRDPFDIAFLMRNGARLNDILAAHLADGRALEILEDPESIENRISQLTGARCAAELQPYLTSSVNEELQRENFEPIRKALRTLFARWL
jgi:hypothetical protein